MEDEINMATSQDILQFHFSPSILKNSAQKVIPVTLSNLSEQRINKLHKINDEVGNSSFSFLGNNLIPHVFRKFKSSIGAENTIFERRDLRTLTYSLNYSERNIQTIFSNENELNTALEAMESKWSDSFLSGLIDCLLNNWETKQKKSLELLAKFITEKLDNYTGARTTLNSFKNNKRYFNTKNGDLILGDTVAKLNRPIQDATRIIGVPASWFSYSYFSRVITTYYDKNKANITDIIDEISDVLQLHNSSITSKRLVSKMIIQANQPAFAILQDKLKKIAFNQIGDPSNVSNWTAFESATETERREILEARNILDEWIAKQFIDIFFRVCINDERRKKFWLKVASKNRVSFKVYGPIRTKNILKRDERILEYLDGRFTIISSNKDTSAFILYIGDYMLIEFSDAGYAFYAYKISGTSKPNLNKRLESVDELRNGSMPMLVYRSGYSINDTNMEGRLTHNDGDLKWEQVFEYWFKNIARINV
jgi:hypothetical protein